MKEYDLSVVIPARNEMFLPRTIKEVLENKRGNTEVIAVLDGYWPDEGIPDHPDLTIIHHTESTGQRQATNEGVRVSRAKFIMKLDAHCKVAEGFDEVLIADCDYEMTMVPRMYNLHAFDWVCDDCGHRSYQGPPECKKCKSRNVKMDVVYKKKRHASDFMWFTPDLKFSYFDRSALAPYIIDGDMNKTKQFYSHKVRPEQSKSDIADQMTCLGACWFLHRERYWELGGLDERHGSWGQMGVELACKSWLSGGRQVVNKKTWFSHMFRTQSEFKFPYPLSHGQTEAARKHSRWLWLEDNWEDAELPLSHMIQHFSPLPGWDKTKYASSPSASNGVTVPEIVSEPKVKLGYYRGIKKEKTKGIVYYTDNRPSEMILQACRNQLNKCCNGHPVVSVSLMPLAFGWENHVLDLPRGYLTMYKQILKGIEESNSDILFFCEHDVLYHPSHFDFVPDREDVYYYNMNVWKVNSKNGHAVTYITKQTSGLVAYRELLLQHYQKRVEITEREGFRRRMGFEPGTHVPPDGVDAFLSGEFRSEFPNVDIRHEHNLTESRWKPEEFRNHRGCRDWQEADEVPGWGHTGDRFEEFIKEFV